MLTMPVPYDPDWPRRFAAYRESLRHALKNPNFAIEHIGSTAVTGMWAKPIIDIQIGVRDLEKFPLDRLQEAGFGLAPDVTSDDPFPGQDAADDCWKKKYVRLEEDGVRLAHIHIRQVGRPNYSFALMFRDFLRTSPTTRNCYSDFKRLAAEAGKLSSEPGGSGTYLDLKDPVVKLIGLSAYEWAQRSGWEPPR